jgi:hypothetical protein
LHTLLKHLLRTFTCLLVLAFASSLYAKGLFWDFLGHAQIDKSRDHGRIQLTRRDVRFRAIQLRVGGEAIFFDRLIIHFDDGTSQVMTVNGRISPAAGNFVIDLAGEHFVETVELWYYKEPWSQNPTVSIYGTQVSDPVMQALAQER